MSPILTICLLYLLYVSYTYFISPILTLCLLYLLYVSYIYSMSPILALCLLYLLCLLYFFMSPTLTLCLLYLLYVSYTHFMAPILTLCLLTLCLLFLKPRIQPPNPPIRLLFLYMQHYRAYLKSWGRSAQPHEPHGCSAQPRNCLKQT